jgi:glucokinase
MQMPVLFTSKTPSALQNLILLAGDIGATKSHLALFSCGAKRLSVIQEFTYRTQDFPDAINMMQAFLSDREPPERICFGVAGPVQSGIVELTNVGWHMDTREISRRWHQVPVYLINDLEATAYGLAALEEKDMDQLDAVPQQPHGNIAVIAPGTGLGEAGLFWDGLRHHPFATEGGHTDFAPRSPTDVALYGYLQQQLGHVSWESVLSGPGIHAIFRFLQDSQKREVPAWLAEEMRLQDPAAVISKNALKSPVCAETMALFFRYLAQEAANLTLKLKATGGLFIGGGIIRKNGHVLDKTVFRNNFCNNGRMQALLQEVPVTLVLNDKTALLGAAYYAAYGVEMPEPAGPSSR